MILASTMKKFVYFANRLAHGGNDTQNNVKISLLYFWARRLSNMEMINLTSSCSSSIFVNRTGIQQQIDIDVILEDVCTNLIHFYFPLTCTIPHGDWSITI